MSRKQEIYQKLLTLGLAYVRNVQTQGRFKKFCDQSCYWEAELIHNLSISILEENFIEHDVHFLNFQARWYFQIANPKLSPNYEINKKLIKELFQIVPEYLKHKLEWSGPT